MIQTLKKKMKQCARGWLLTNPILFIKKDVA